MTAHFLWKTDVSVDAQLAEGKKAKFWVRTADPMVTTLIKAVKYMSHAMNLSLARDQRDSTQQSVTAS